MSKPTIYEECIKRGIPVQNHYSDLYIPVTEETTNLLTQFGKAKKPFVNRVERGLWYDVALSYDPYWSKKV